VLEKADVVEERPSFVAIKSWVRAIFCSSSEGSALPRDVSQFEIQDRGPTATVLELLQSSPGFSRRLLTAKILSLQKNSASKQEGRRFGSPSSLRVPGIWSRSGSGRTRHEICMLLPGHELSEKVSLEWVRRELYTEQVVAGTQCGVLAWRRVLEVLTGGQSLSAGCL
jgi:hypothetical protein